MATHSSALAQKIPRTEEPGVHGVAESDTTEQLHFLIREDLDETLYMLSDLFIFHFLGTKMIHEERLSTAVNKHLQ